MVNFDEYLDLKTFYYVPKSLIPIKYSLHIVIKTSTQFSYLMKSKTPPLYVGNEVQVFKLMAPSINSFTTLIEKIISLSFTHYHGYCIYYHLTNILVPQKIFKIMSVFKVNKKSLSQYFVD